MNSFESAMTARQHARALWLDRLEGPETAIALEAFGIAAGSNAHSEGWLQNLIFRFPQVLPVAEIEPAFGELFPVCTELPTPAGYADNLFVTGNGNLVIVECKLWRNPEARRESRGPDHRLCSRHGRLVLRRPRAGGPASRRARRV